MAEFVEFRMQDMLPILEKIKQIKLLPQNQLKELIGTLQEREFKIQRPARTLDDFLKYFELLKDLISLLKIRREKLAYFHNTTEIEDRIKSIITSRFGMANRNFKHDLRFWKFQINYLKGMNWPDRVSDVFTEVTKLHGVKHPFLWVDASNFEWTRKPGKGIENARKFIQLGIRKHPSLLLLYVQGFHLELKYIEHLLISQKHKEELLEKENGKAILEDLLLARTFYKSAKIACKNDGPKLCLEFYNTAKPFKFTEKLREEIKTNLTEEHYDHESAWDFAAKIALAENGKVNSAGITKGITLYEEGLKYKPTVQMYDYYLHTLQFLEAKVSDHDAKSKLVDLQIQLYERAFGNMKLSMQNYVNWYNLVNNFNHSVEKFKISNTVEKLRTPADILKLGLSKFPNSSQLIGQHIRRHIKLFDNRVQPTKQELEGLFETTLKDLMKITNEANGDSSIWKFLFLYLVTHDNSTPEMLKRLIDSAPNWCGVQGDLKCLYIQHMSLTDMDEARLFYTTHCISPGIPLKFHLEMAKLELFHIGSLEPKSDIFKHVKVCYENAVRDFGKDNIELWLDYITFENKIRANGKNQSQIYSRALQILSEDKKEEFINSENKLCKQKFSYHTIPALT